MKKSSHLFALLLITFLGGFLRFYQLDIFPISPNWDEVSHGYNAYSILQTGRDEWGTRLPMIFRAFGDFKLPLYIYLTIIPVKIFGLSVFSLRFISALAGTLAVPAIYLLSKNLLKSNPLALLASFLLSISTYHIFQSRPALEANLSLTLIIAGFAILTTATRKKIWYFLGGLLLALSLHTYNSARVFVPLTYLLFLIICPKDKRFEHLKSSLPPLLLGLVIVLFQIFDGSALARFQKLAILDENTIFQIGQNRSSSPLPPLISKLVYNRPVYLVSRIATNYLSIFSGSFLFQSTNFQAQFAIPNFPLFPVIFIPFLVIGLFASDKFMLGWLLLSPIAASLTNAPTQALRPNLIIPAIILITVCGLKHFKKAVLVLSVLLTVFSLQFLSSFFNLYTGDYTARYSSSWQYGYKEAFEYLKGIDNSKKIFVTKRLAEPHIFYAFYNQLDPQKMFPAENNIRFMQTNWYWTDKINNYFFINDWKIPNQSPANTLILESGGVIDTNDSILVTSPDHLPSNLEVLKIINYPDGKPVFVIGQLK